MDLKTLKSLKIVLDLVESNEWDEIKRFVHGSEKAPTYHFYHDIKRVERYLWRKLDSTCNECGGEKFALRNYSENIDEYGVPENGWCESNQDDSDGMKGCKDTDMVEILEKSLSKAISLLSRRDLEKYKEWENEQ